MEYIQDTLFGKTYQEPFQAIKGWILNPCLKKSQKPVFQFLDITSGQNQEWLEAESVQSYGEHWMPSIGESPKDGVESSLSQIIQTGGTEEILFKPEVLSRDTKQGRTEREGTRPIPDGHTAKPISMCLDMSHACDVVRVNEDVCPTLQHRMGTGGNNIPLTIDKPMFCVGNGQLAQLHKQDTVGALNCMHDQQIVAICQRDGKAIAVDYRLRRLTPLECERLQGLPDNWTLIDDKTCSDSARYKAIGNGMAQPCADFVIERIAEHDNRRVQRHKCS